MAQTKTYDSDYKGNIPPFANNLGGADAPLNRLGEMAQQGVKNYPYAALGVAFGAGIVLGSGLISRSVAMKALSVGGRMLAANIARGALGL